MRALADEKLKTLESRLLALTQARDLLRDVLRHWDVLLEHAPAGQRAGLLDALEHLVEAGMPSPFVPPALHRLPQRRS